MKLKDLLIVHHFEKVATACFTFCCSTSFFPTVRKDCEGT